MCIRDRSYRIASVRGEGQTLPSLTSQDSEVQFNYFSNDGETALQGASQATVPASTVGHFVTQGSSSAGGWTLCADGEHSYTVNASLRLPTLTKESAYTYVDLQKMTIEWEQKDCPAKTVFDPSVLEKIKFYPIPVKPFPPIPPVLIKPIRGL